MSLTMIASAQYFFNIYVLGASPEDVLNLMSEIFTLKRKITELTNENENLKSTKQKCTCTMESNLRRDSGIQVISADVYNGDGSHAFTTLL